MKRITLEQIDLGDIIGTGTVGTVYRGRLKSTGENVAVKFLQPSISDDQLVRARFRREMSILSRLEHPHIIRYYGGSIHNDQLFYAMEALEGGTIKDLLERFGAMSWQEVASIGRQVSSALQHAHNHGIIHRDLKPGNLFLDSSGQIKLGDFGIARDTHSADLTHQGLTVGTHAYMAPEQITGDQDINGKADLYSLGCVLFELLCGQKPFAGTNFAVLFEQHLRKPAPRVTEFVSDCPPALADTIAELLEKDPDKRPFNARTVQGVMLELLIADPSHSAVESQSSSGSGDVAAAAVTDAGMRVLANKLRPQVGSQVSWQALAVVGVVTLIVICFAALATSG